MPGPSTTADHPFSTALQRLGERPASFSWASVRQEFAPSPTRVHSAVKLALGGTITLVLAYWFNWSSPANAMVPPLLLNRPDIRYDLRQSLVAGTSAAVMGSFYYWSLNFSQAPLWFALVLGGGLLCYGALTTLPGIGQSLSIGQVIPSLVLALYFYAPNAREALYFPRTMELLLGFTVAIGVNGLLWPYSPRKEWDERFRRAWSECRQMTARWFAGEEPIGGKVHRPDSLDRQLEEALGLLGERIKPTDPADEGPAVRTAAVRRLEEIIFLLQDLRRLGLGSTPGIDSVLDRLGREIDGSFAKLEEVLAGKEPVALGEPDKSLLDAAFPELPPEDEKAPGNLLRQADLRRLREILGGCPDIFRALARLPGAESVTRREQSLIYSAPFHLKDLRQLGVQSWQHGAKVALIVLSSFGLWQAFRWPGGPTVVASALIVTLTDLGRSARQAILRVLGLVLGLVCAFLCTALVVKYVETIFGYGLCVFLVLLVLGYLAGTSPRLAYIGFQGAVSFVLVFISDDQQSVSLLPLWTRFAGLTFGVFIATIILQNLWPVRKVKDLFAGLAENLAVCARAWSALFQGRPEEAAAAQEDVIQQFNQGWAKSIVLTNGIEFEGGEGTPRYGYAGRLLTHETALFEQIRLCGMEWAELARDSTPPPAEVRAIQAKLQRLVRQLGHPVELPAPESNGGSGAPAPDGQTPPGQYPLEQRFGEIEQILGSLERLTMQPIPS